MRLSCLCKPIFFGVLAVFILASAPAAHAVSAGGSCKLGKNIRMYSQPDASADNKTISKGTDIRILSIKDDFARVSIWGDKGFMEVKKLKGACPEEPKPAKKPAAKPAKPAAPAKPATPAAPVGPVTSGKRVGPVVPGQKPAAPAVPAQPAAATAPQTAPQPQPFKPGPILPPPTGEANTMTLAERNQAGQMKVMSTAVVPTAAPAPAMVKQYGKDVVVMSNGTRFTGKVLKIKLGEYVIFKPNAETRQTINWRHIWMITQNEKK